MSEQPRVRRPKLANVAMAAATMTLDDLHFLGDLPFDLTVYTGWSTEAELPAEIRSHYRALNAACASL